MAAGYGIGKFISGMVDGGEIAHNWQDRKRRQKLEDEDRVLAKEDRARRIAREDERDAAWRNTEAHAEWTRGKQRSEYERAEAERAEATALHDTAVKAAEEAADAAMIEATGADASASSPEAITRPTTKAVEPERGIKRPAPAAKAPKPPGKSPAVKPPAPSEAAPPVPQAPAPGPSMAVPGAAMAAEPPMMRGANEPPWAGGGIARPPAAAATGPAVPPSPDASPETWPAAPDTRRGVIPATRVGPVPSPATPPSPDENPAGWPGAPRSEAQPGAAAAAEPAPRAPVPSAAPASPVPPVTPSVEAAVSTARSIKPTTPAKKRTYEQAFMDAYRDEQVPRIVRHYLSKGDTASADSFAKWAQDSATQEGMRAWARSTAAATIGDEEGFLDNFTEAFNAPGYFDNGLSIVREGSGFARDDKGNILGADITFRNDETGETWTQRFEDDDLYRLGVNYLSPENVYETGKASIAAANEAAAAALEHERAMELEAVKAGFKGKSTSELLDAEVESLRKNDLSGSFSSLPVAEQVAKAIESLEAKRAALAGGAGPAAVVAARGE